MSMAESESLAERSKPGYAGYSPFVLGIYDFWVHGINNRFFWKCPTRTLIAHYDKHITANHLEIGLGTGYLLDKCVIPGPQPRLVFCDMNPNCLEKACDRLRRYVPLAFQRNVLEPLDGLGEPFQSVGLNYVMHCLPGDMASKRMVFQHIAAVLKPGGVLFGSTLLSREVPVSLPARLQMKVLNWRGYFSNSNDGLSQLTASLKEAFADSEVRVHGCAALFWARTRG
jgi:SAM-dependent methyltransferase